MKREDVYKLIDGERDYQDQNTCHKDNTVHPGDWLIFIEHHLQEGKDRVYNLESNNAMEQIRKIAALAVAAMEHIPTKRRLR